MSALATCFNCRRKFDPYGDAPVICLPGRDKHSWRPPIDGDCYAGKDGECTSEHCHQARDGEPEKSGRSCPGKGWGDDDDY